MRSAARAEAWAAGVVSAAHGSQVPWVPLDESFDEIKQNFFVGSKMNGIGAAIPSLAAEVLTGSPHIGTFSSYAAYDAMYSMGGCLNWQGCNTGSFW